MEIKQNKNDVDRRTLDCRALVALVLCFKINSGTYFARVAPRPRCLILLVVVEKLVFSDSLGILLSTSSDREIYV